MENKLKILMLEDVESDVDLIGYVLKKEGISFIGKQVDTRDEFLAGVEEFKPDIVLSDHALPQFNSVEAYKICKEKGLSIPFILVTGTVSEEFAVSCLKQGIDDYVLKSNLSRLPSAILNSLKQRQLEIERQETFVKLQQQNEDILKINNELDNFSYSISHNLRAPLASVKGLLDLAKYEDQKEQSRFVDIHVKIEESINKLDVTLKQMLDHSRNARLDVVPEKIDIRKLIAETLQDLSYLEGTSSIQQSITISGETPFYTDKYRLSVVFKNILSNSIKYRDTTKNVQNITILATIISDKVCLQFHDNGMGIAKEVLPKVFNMFYRGTEKSDGAGLGLYILNEVIEKLNGHIHLSSKEKQGTIITVVLPNLYPTI